MTDNLGMSINNDDDHEMMMKTRMIDMMNLGMYYT